MTGDATEPAPPPPQHPEQAPRPTTRRIRSADLLREARDLIILHNDEEYHLRITRLGKLILTK